MMNASRPTTGSGPPVGEQGGVPVPKTCADVRLLAMALERAWPMDAEKRLAAYQRLAAVAADPERPVRAVMAATKILAQLDAVTLRAIEVAIKVREQGELAERLASIEERLKEGAHEHRDEDWSY